MDLSFQKNIKKVFEFGGGSGCMARIFSKINKNIEYNIFDTQVVNLLQYYYLKHNGLNVGFEKDKKIFLSSNFNNLNKKNDLFIANWSLSEVPYDLRKKFYKIISQSKFILICFQEKFEDMNNLKYFENLKNKLTKKYKIKIIKNQFYKGNLIFKQNHYFLVGKKIT